MTENLKTNKKVVVVVGGAGYLGSFVVPKLIAENFFVVIIDHKQSSNLENEKSLSLVADMSNQKAVQDVANKVKNDFNQVAAIIYLASAPLVRQGLLEQTEQDFLSQFSVNVLGAFNFFKAFCPMLEVNGAVIGLTTKAINPGERTMAAGAYVSAKLALRGLLKTLSGELKNSARVYDVAPAFMPGGLNNDLPAGVLEFIKTKSQPEDITQPEVVTEVICQLINDYASKLSGRIITVPSHEITVL